MKYHYFLFDLDGTLTDSSEGICKSVQYALSKMGIEEGDLRSLEKFIGPPLRMSFMEHYGFEGDVAEEAVAFYRERYNAVGKFENVPYEGIPQLLQALKEAGAVLGIASSKPDVFVHEILDHFELSQYFDVICGSDLEGKRDSKEAVIEAALEQMGVKCEADKTEVLMIGDRHFDIDGAKYFGLDSAGVYYGFAKPGELEAAGATYVVNTVEELHTLLCCEGQR